MKKIIISLVLISVLTGCAGYSQLTTSLYNQDAAMFNGGIPQTQNIAALRKQVVVTGLQNEIVRNNADSQHAILGVTDHRLGVEGHAEDNRHDATRNRINEFRSIADTAIGLTNFFRSF